MTLECLCGPFMSLLELDLAMACFQCIDKRSVNSSYVYNTHFVSIGINSLRLKQGIFGWVSGTITVVLLHFTDYEWKEYSMICFLMFPQSNWNVSWVRDIHECTVVILHKVSQTARYSSFSSANQCKIRKRATLSFSLGNFSSSTTQTKSVLLWQQHVNLPVKISVSKQKQQGWAPSKSNHVVRTLQDSQNPSVYTYLSVGFCNISDIQWLPKNIWTLKPHLKMYECYCIKLNASVTFLFSVNQNVSQHSPWVNRELIRWSETSFIDGNIISFCCFNYLFNNVLL